MHKTRKVIMAGIRKEVWYSNGLRFQCTQCGDCCSGSEGYVWVNQEEINAMAARLGVSPLTFEERFVKRVGVRRSLTERANGDCVLLDEKTRKCTAYEERPRQCKTWPFWDSNLRTPEAWAEAAEACPGCDKGNLVPLEKIVEQAAKIRI
jgi:hypothetical protein